MRLRSTVRLESTQSQSAASLAIIEKHAAFQL
jgi:hypothetical protein